MNKIAVFCSASDVIEPVFMEKARELGAWLGQHRKWLVYRTDGSSGKKCERERGNDYGSCSHKAGGTRKSQRFA